MFQARTAAQICANYTGTSTKFTIGGTNAAETDEENAAKQINKILDIFGKSISTSGMTQIITKEVAPDV